MPERFFQHTFANGLTLLCETMPGMQSAAMTLLLPAGSEYDPADACGSATVLAELVLRGAGSLSSRELTDHLDHLGLQRSSSVGVHHARFASAAVAKNVVEGITTYADIVRWPHLPEEGFEAARDLAVQSLEGIDDDPRQRLMIELRKLHLPYPLGRNTMGEIADLQSMTVDQCRAHHARLFRPSGAILAMAGNLDPIQTRDEVGKRLGDWTGQAPTAVERIAPRSRCHHQTQESEQTHIGIAYPTISETHAEYYTLRLVAEALGGGMSGRLFTEIREKRGLAYSVSAGYSGLKGVGSILGYAGTSPDRAQATLDCFIAELHRVTDGITIDELHRAQIGLKASTIMAGESTSARSASIAHDYFMRGRIRSMQEILDEIDAVTIDRANAFLKTNPPADLTIVTVGPQELKFPTPQPFEPFIVTPL